MLDWINPQYSTQYSRIWSVRAAWWTFLLGCLWHCRFHCSTWTPACWDWSQSPTQSLSGWLKSVGGCRCHPGIFSFSRRSPDIHGNKTTFQYILKSSYFFRGLSTYLKKSILNVIFRTEIQNLEEGVTFSDGSFCQSCDINSEPPT